MWWLTSSCLWLETLAAFCENYNEISGSILVEHFLASWETTSFYEKPWIYVTAILLRGEILRMVWMNFKVFWDITLSHWIIQCKGLWYVCPVMPLTFQKTEIIERNYFHVSCSYYRTIWYGSIREDCPYMLTLVDQLHHLKVGFITTCSPATETILPSMWREDKAAHTRKSSFIETTSPRMSHHIKISSFWNRWYSQIVL